MVPSIRTTSGTRAAASVLLRGPQHSAVSGSTIASVRRTFHDNNSSDNTKPKQQQQQRPNRLTAAYNEMQRQCPQVIADYAGCIQANADDLLKNTCHKEFDAVRECFRHARRSATNANMVDWNHP